VSDAEIVERARAGDVDAFSALVERHRAAVYRAALAALGSPADAEDVAQEAFVTAFRKLATFRGDSSFKTWMLSVAWREALDRRRSLKARLRRFVASSEDGAGPEPAAAGRDPEAALLDAELAHRVGGLVRRLPAKLRDPLLLLASGDHGYQEISTLLDVPVGTLKWRVSEARRLLRERLERLGYGGAA
jgi:RNA polymerase sigma factor (sigma-70 family)